MTRATPKTSTKPVLWAVCNYPEGSGGYNAFNGVVRLFSARTGMDVQSIEAKKMITDFWASAETVLAYVPSSMRPNTAIAEQQTRALLKRALQEVASELFFKTHGQPEALLMSIEHGFLATHQTSASEHITLKMPGHMFVTDGLSIMNWCRHMPDGYHNLTPHNLTHENLASEAARFSQALKSDGKPLIAIVLGGDDVSSRYTRALEALAAQMPDARFVLSSSPRSPKQLLAEVCDEFKALLSPEQHTHLVVYDFHEDDKNANPYRALLTLADHMIIIGRSESMVSERLFAGCTVYYGYGSDAGAPERIYGAELAGSGKVKYFPHKGALKTEPFPSIDATTMIVDSLVDRYETKKIEPEHEPWPELEMVKGRMRQALPSSILG